MELSLCLRYSKTSSLQATKKNPRSTRSTRRKISVSFLYLIAFDFKIGFPFFVEPLDYPVFCAFDFLVFVFAADCTFPDDADAPALFLIVFEVFGVARFVPLKFFLPETLV